MDNCGVIFSSHHRYSRNQTHVLRPEDICLYLLSHLGPLLICFKTDLMYSRLLSNFLCYKMKCYFQLLAPSFCSSDSRITGMIYHVWLYMKFLSEAIIWYEFDRRTNVFIKLSLFLFTFFIPSSKNLVLWHIFPKTTSKPDALIFLLTAKKKKKWMIPTKKEKRKKEIHWGIKKSIHTYTWINKSMFNEHMYTYEIQEYPIFYSTKFLDITCMPDSTLTVRSVQQQVLYCKKNFY